MTPLLAAVVLAFTAPAKAPPQKLTLPQLYEHARKNPQLEAARHAVRAAEAQWREAVRAWIPTIEYTGLLAPSPDIQCFRLEADPNAPGGFRKIRDPANCVNTTNPNPSLDAIGFGVFGRVEIRAGMPLYTFGKLDAAKQLATEGVHAARLKGDQARVELELNLAKAYYGAKTAREVLATIGEGREKLQDAIEKLEKDLDSGEGDAQETDLLRLRAAAATIDARSLEAVKGHALALAALRMLAGLPGVAVDDAPIEPVPLPPRPEAYWLERARAARPESRLLDVAVRAKKQQLALEVARYYPDLALVGTYTYAYAGTADDPGNAFYSDPFNGQGFGVALALKGSLDFHMKVPRVDRIRAELAELEANQAAANAGIALEVKKALADVDEARQRLPILQKGLRASRSWLFAISQNFSIGLAEGKDFNDALVAFFEAELRSLQAIYDFNVAVAQLGRVTGVDPTR